MTGGEFNIDHEGDWLVFRAPGFLLDHAPVGANYGLWVEKLWNANTCFIPMTDERCTVGEVLDASFRTPANASLGVGRATVDGRDYSDVTFRGTLDFRVDPMTLAAGPDGFTPLSSPFVFRALIRGFSSAGTEMFSVSLAGGGSTYIPTYLEGTTYFGEDGKVVYRFEEQAPVPEPTSLLLIGSGLAGLAVRRRMAPPGAEHIEAAGGLIRSRRRASALDCCRNGRAHLVRAHRLLRFYSAGD